MNTREFSNNTKKKSILALALVAVLLIGTTLAFLSTKTNDKTNVFTFGNISAELEEPNWHEPGDGSGEPPSGQNLTPGAEVKKDPQIKNTSPVDEYVAIKLTFQNAAGGTLSAGDFARLISLIDIKYNDAVADTGLFEDAIPGYNLDTSGATWTNFNGTSSAPVQLFYYNDLVPGSEDPTDSGLDSTTVPLFDWVKIKAITDDEYAWLSGTATSAQLTALAGKGGVWAGLTTNLGGWNGVGDSPNTGGFKIFAEGAAIEAAGYDDATDAAITNVTTVGDLLGLFS
ncbi:MAG: hypothetical protein LBN34_03710 [Clostridiales Family XIII bacterium]|jgi:hypothetical protein|nr:hypothetical protein [Clostridiales Family XIII bacterium]